MIKHRFGRVVVSAPGRRDQSAASSIGRVGGLAAALGVGVVLFATPWAATADADTSSSPAGSESSSESSSSETRPAGTQSSTPSDPSGHRSSSDSPDSDEFTSGHDETDLDEELANEVDGDDPVAHDDTEDTDTDTDTDQDVELDQNVEPDVDDLDEKPDRSYARTTSRASAPKSPDPTPGEFVATTAPTSIGDDTESQAVATGTIPSPEAVSHIVTATDTSETATAISTTPARALQHQPGAFLEVASTMISAAVAPLVSGSTPAAPDAAPVIWGLSGWVRREIEDTYTNYSIAIGGHTIIQRGTAVATSEGFGSIAIARGDNATATATGLFSRARVIGDDSVGAANGNRARTRIIGDANTADARGVASRARVRGDGNIGAANGNRARTRIVGDANTADAQGVASRARVRGGASTAATNGERSIAIVVGDRSRAITDPGPRRIVVILGDDLPPGDPENQAPIAGTPGPQTIDPETGSATGTLGFADPDGDPLTYDLDTEPDNGAVLLNADGTYTYTPTSRPPFGDPDGTDSFTVTAADPAGLTATSTIGVTVAALPDPGNQPPTTGDTTLGAPDATTGSVDGDLNAVDPDGDPLTYTVTGEPARGAVVVNTDGTFTYTPTLAARIAAFGTAGTDTDGFTVQVSDGVNPAVTVTVDGVPVAPGTPAETATIDLDSASAVAISPDGATAYVTGGFSGQLTIIDTATNTVLDTIDVGNDASGVAISPDGDSVYITDQTADTVVVIDATTKTVITTIDVGDGPYRIALSPDGTRAYTTNQFDDTVSVIDTTTNTVIGTVAIDTDAFPFAVALTPDGSRAYVVNASDFTVSVIDTATNTVIGTPVAVGLGASGLSISPDGSEVYVANYSDESVSVIDTTTNTVVDTITVGGKPFGAAHSPDGSLVYITTSDEDTVSVIHTATRTVVATVAVGAEPFEVAFLPDGRAYITSESADTVSQIVLVTQVDGDATPVLLATAELDELSVGAPVSGPDGTVYQVVLTGGLFDTGASVFVLNPDGSVDLLAESDGSGFPTGELAFVDDRFAVLTTVDPGTSNDYDSDSTRVLVMDVGSPGTVSEVEIAGTAAHGPVIGPDGLIYQVTQRAAAGGQPRVARVAIIDPLDPDSATVLEFEGIGFGTRLVAGPQANTFYAAANRLDGQTGLRYVDLYKLDTMSVEAPLTVVATSPGTTTNTDAIVSGPDGTLYLSTNSSQTPPYVVVIDPQNPDVPVLIELNGRSGVVLGLDGNGYNASYTRMRLDPSDGRTTVDTIHVRLVDPNNLEDPTTFDAPGAFPSPDGALAVGPDGTIFITTEIIDHFTDPIFGPKTHHVAVVDPQNPDDVTLVDLEVGAEDELTDVTMAVDGDGRAHITYLADIEADGQTETVARLVIIDPADPANPVRVDSPASSPAKVAVAEDGTVYFTTITRVGDFGPATTSVAVIDPDADEPVLAVFEFEGAGSGGVTFGSGGIVYQGVRDNDGGSYIAIIGPGTAQTV